MTKKAKGTFADKLAALRHRLRLSQQKVAAHLEIPVSTLRGWEQGRHEPTVYVQRFVLRLLEQHSG